LFFRSAKSTLSVHPASESPYGNLRKNPLRHMESTHSQEWLANYVKDF
jgi:hypothetical protein